MGTLRGADNRLAEGTKENEARMNLIDIAHNMYYNRIARRRT